MAVESSCSGVRAWRPPFEPNCQASSPCLLQMAEAPTLPRGQLVQLIAGMVKRKGPAMEAELRRRIAVGQDFEIKGIKVDAPLLKEALEKHRAESSGRPRPSGNLASAHPATSSGARAGAHWTLPPSQKASSARWTPGTPSASLLAARALQECEQAEVFCRSVEAANGVEVPLFVKPDYLAEQTGETLQGGSVHEVVARFVSQKDGRVYLRLKSLTGWVSTRACDCFTTPVLAAIQGEPPLEPSKCQEPIESRALEILPHLDAGEIGEAVADPDDAIDGEGEAEERAPGDEDGEPEDAAPEHGADAEFEGAAEDEVGDSQAAKEGEEEGHEEEEEGGEGEVSDKENHESEADQSPSKPTSRRFKVLIGRCQIIDMPDAEHLMATSTRMLQHKEEFLADGAVFVPAEQRTYLRLTRGRGWVCERSRGDLRRLAVVPVTRRKKPISKKMAKAVVFRGGDTDGVTKLRKEDLTKNSQGKIVSKRASEAAKKRYAEGIGRWTAAVKRARDELGLEGFVKVKKGSPVYEQAMVYYKQAAPEPAKE